MNLAEHLSEVMTGLRPFLQVSDYEVPADTAEAFVVQTDLLKRLVQSVGAWKVGMAPEAGKVWASPIPASWVFGGIATLPRGAFGVCGLELELAFRFDRDFEASNLPADDAEILSALQWVAPAIEVVSSRYQNWPDVDDRFKLADFLNNGALIVGQQSPLTALQDVSAPSLELWVNDQSCARTPSGNPAGDPRQLLAPFVRQCVDRGMSIRSSQWITTGSYSGICFVESGTTRVRAMIEGLGEVRVTLNESLP